MMIACDIRAVLALALATGLWAGAQAEPVPAGRTYTLNDCLALARARNATLTNARRDEAIAETRITQVRAQALPELTVAAGYTRLGEVPGMEFDGQRIALGRADNYNAGIEVGQLLYSGGSVRAALRAADDYRRLAVLDSARATALLERDVRVAYVEVLLAQRRLAVRRQAVAQLEAFATQVAQRHAQALVSDFERDSARVRVANERPLAIAAEGALTVARVRLAHLVHLDDARFTLEDRLDDGAPAVAVALADAWRTALEHRPELAQARRLIELRRADIRHAQGRYLPQLRAHAAYNGLNPPSGGGADEWDWDWNAGLTLEWKLFDGALREGEIAEKRLALDKADEDAGEIKRAIRLEVETAHAEWLTACETVRATSETAALAEANLTIARARYDAGLATQLEFSDARLALSTAQLGHYEALAGRARAEAELDYARGAIAMEGAARGHE